MVLSIWSLLLLWWLNLTELVGGGVLDVLLRFVSVFILFCGCFFFL